MARHVIILGAGASMSSGYPDAARLRLLITSRSFLTDWFDRFSDIDVLERKLYSDQYWQAMSAIDGNALGYFQHGAFATVDEFSKLSLKGKYAKFVPELKRAMRIALSVRNPDERFYSSEYVPLIQRLFLSDEARIRDDLTILTFNYDCFFEHALGRAYLIRRKVDVERLEEHATMFNAIHSGFYDPKDRAWSAQKFKVLKLHGSIAFVKPKTGDIGHDALFRRPEIVRHTSLYPLLRTAPVPPVVFPWELFTEDQRAVLPYEQFCTGHPADWPRRELYGLLNDVWQQAQDAVKAADKISFVGISAHSYLFPGLRYLFSGKETEFSAVVANKQNEDKALLYDSDGRSFNPLSVTGRIEAIIREICPSARRYGDKLVKPVGSFRSFIETEI